ncbi:hypothetical protein ACWC9Q_32420 [Streptomyces sp. NPDC001142]
MQRALAPGDRPFLGLPDHLGQVMAELAPLLGLFTHQQGSPYDNNHFDDGARAYEKAVLTYFAALAGASLDEAHGYVAASPREALLHGLVLARRGLPEPSVYVSAQAHYDVVRACAEQVVLEDPVVLPDGRQERLLRILAERPEPPVAVLPLLDGQVVLVDRFRHAARTWTWEILRGAGAADVGDAQNAVG